MKSNNLLSAVASLHSIVGTCVSCSVSYGTESCRKAVYLEKHLFRWIFIFFFLKMRVESGHPNLNLPHIMARRSDWTSDFSSHAEEAGLVFSGDSREKLNMQKKQAHT